MPGYFSEIAYKDGNVADFIEVAVPKGTDVSGYTIQVYNASGALQETYGFGASTQTVAQQDVYLFDSTTTGWNGVGSGHAIAIVDDLGNVVQFVSFGGTITAVEGDANGLTSTDIGTSAIGQSLQSDNGGSSYYAQSTPNAGTIPCYAPGTLIETPDGPRAVEALVPGDLVMTLDHGPMPVRWTSRRDQPLEDAAPGARPVLIRAGALGPGRPARDLVVSPQHRILAGGRGQLAGPFGRECFVPAKALTGLPGIRVMAGRRRVAWHHFALDWHAVVRAEGCLTESLLLGPMVTRGLTALQRRALAAMFAAAPGEALNGAPARRCLTVGEARRALSGCRAAA